VFGTPTGKSAHAHNGEHLPAAPRGFAWRGTSKQLRERASPIAVWPRSATTAPVGDELTQLAERLESMAAQRDEHTR
jgi:hypothetical protein